MTQRSFGCFAQTVWFFRFYVQISWPNEGVLPNYADGTTERACYFAVVCT